MRKNKLYILIVAMIFVLAYTACGSSDGPESNYAEKSAYSEEYDASYETPAEAPAEDLKGETNSTALQSDASEFQNNEKMIIRTTLYVETESFDDSVSKIESLTKEAKGYIESVYADYGRYYDKTINRRIEYSIRIPKGKTDSVIKSIKTDVGLVVNESMTTENVTKRIKDIDREIQVSKAKEDRLLALTEKTDDIEALIKLETELASTIANREMKQADLKNLEHDVSYDFLTLTLQEVRQVTVIQEERSFVGDLKSAFAESIENFVSFLRDFAIFIAYKWIELIVIGLFIFGVVKLSKKLSAKVKSRPKKVKTNKAFLKREDKKEEKINSIYKEQEDTHDTNQDKEE